MTATLQAEIHALSSRINAIATRLDNLAVKPGDAPDSDAEEEKAELRMERDRLIHERSQLVAQVDKAKAGATHTLRYVLADNSPATFEKAWEPIRHLMAELEKTGVIVSWEAS